MVVSCSKGTYIRTLCHDIGQKLGCGGCMSSLRRTKAGCYDLSQSVTMAQITAMENPESRLLPVESLFADLPAYTIHDNQKKAVYNGAAVRAANLQPGLYRVFAPDGEFLMVGKAKDGQLTTVKSFFEVSKP